MQVISIVSIVFLFMQVITIVLCIVLDFISTFFCMQVITMVFWTVLDLIFTFFHMLFWGETPGVGLDLHHLLLASDHRDVLD